MDDDKRTWNHRPLGCLLAMAVMQSELYRHLDDSERAECDELVRLNLDWMRNGDDAKEKS